MPTVKFNAQLLAAVSPCIGTEKTRYYLTGIYFEPHPNRGAMAIATDGHALVCAYDPEGVAPEKGILLGEFKGLLKDLKPARNDPRARVFSWGDSLASIAFTDREGEDPEKPFSIQPMREIDGSFPDWKRTVPSLKGDQLALAGFAAKQVKRLTEVSTILNGADSPVVIYSEDASAPALVRFNGRPDVFAVQMPMRANTDSALPGFYRDIIYGTPAERSEAAE